TNSPRIFESHVNFAACLALLCIVAGCAPADEPANGVEALRTVFAPRAVRVLGGESRFVREGAQYSSLSEGVLENDDMALAAPLRGGGQFVLSAGDFEIRFREEGARGAAELVDAALSYRRPGATTFWRATTSGYAEWLLFEQGVGDTEHVASWVVEGARVVQHGRSVDLYDAAGKPRITVSALAAYPIEGPALPLRLTAEGQRIVLSVEGASPDQPLLIDPGWAYAGNMSEPRRDHTATTLADGRVLVVGGRYSLNGPGAFFDGIELFDLTTMTFMAGAPLSVPRAGHSATSLEDGTILVAGGIYSKLGTTYTAESYDPIADAWAPAGVLSRYRGGHAAVRLPDGDVMIFGGDGVSGVIGSSERYYTDNNTWTGTAGMDTYMPQQTATLLPSGKVLVTRGSHENVHALYDPETDTWQPTEPEGSNSFGKTRGHTTEILPSGRVLKTGGWGYGSPAFAATIYDPAANTWVETDQMKHGRTLHASVVMPDGRVVVSGGNQADAGALQSDPTDAVQAFDESTETWTSLPSMGLRRWMHTMSLVPGGRLLVLGGWSGAPGATLLSSASLYYPGPFEALGAACYSDDQCVSKHCVEGVCCDSACEGVCETCSVDAGALMLGECTALSGTPCDDDNPCTKNDACNAGKCAPGNAKMCGTVSECREPGICDTNTGKCEYAPRPDDSPCADGTRHCVGGNCWPGAPDGSDPPSPDAGVSGEGGAVNGARRRPAPVLIDGCACRFGAPPRHNPNPSWPVVMAVALTAARRRRSADFEQRRAET
ncbi:hypothetical protein JYT22_01120, partial [Endomicrobium sp. AH-315-J14]|nr:hypothetical protein [Endomicrobium sp. AH-315-J14]